MKIIVLYFFLQFISIVSLIGSNDSIVAVKHSINIEVGLPTSIFLDKNSTSFTYRRNIYKPFIDFRPPVLASLSYIRNEKYIVSLRFLDYQKITTMNNLKQGEMSGMVYSNVEFLFGRVIRLNHLLIEPSISINQKFKGFQHVLLGYRPSGWNEPISQTYLLKSKGIGMNINARKKIFKGLNFSTEVSYLHYFEKNKMSEDSRRNGLDDFYNTYKVNRNTINITFKIGYNFSF